MRIDNLRQAETFKGLAKAEVRGLKDSRYLRGFASTTYIGTYPCPDSAIDTYGTVSMMLAPLQRKQTPVPKSMPKPALARQNPFQALV